MELKPLIRQVLDDPNASRYSDELIDELITEALRFISLYLGTFVKTVKLQATQDGQIFLENNLGVVKVENNCNVQVKHILELDCKERCNVEQDSISSLKYLVFGNDDMDLLTLCPNIKSISLLDDIETVIQQTATIHLAHAPVIPPEYIVITYKTIPALSEMPQSWKKLVYYYVTGNLLRFDKSEANQQFGEMQLKHLRHDMDLLQAVHNSY